MNVLAFMSDTKTSHDGLRVDGSSGLESRRVCMYSKSIVLVLECGAVNPRACE